MPLVKIRNRYLENVTWLSSSACDFNISGHSSVWRINISNNLALLDDFAQVINADETARANRYMQVRDKNRFIISRGALRIILGRYLNRQLTEIAFETGTNKKPFIKDSSLQYNVSHSGDWIVIAISNTAVGVDIEWINSGFQYQEIINEYFSAEESAYIAADDAHSRFFLLWTRKEALTKATAKGLDDDLKFIPSLEGDHEIDETLVESTLDWHSDSFELSPGYLATLTTSAQIDHLRFWDAGLLKSKP